MCVGIITEYNPFHNGHLYHLNASKKITGNKNVIAVMSGNFVQRGEPAICNKQTRTKSALLNGVDIVLELPLYYATSSADVFAFAAVDILNKTGIVNSLCFGSEEGNLDTMISISKVLSNETKEFKELLKSELNTGISYPKARQNALSILLNKDLAFLNNPNNILSIEYLKALDKLNSKIIPYTISRKDASFHSTEIKGNIASATSIRTAIYNNNTSLLKDCIPENSIATLLDSVKKSKPSINDYSQILHYILRTKQSKYISEIADITEGLENRIFKNSDINLITDIISKLKTKRYTYSKLQRALLHIILDIKKSNIDFYIQNHGIPYIRVLGFRKESSYLLKNLANNSKVPIITNISKANKILDSNAMSMLNAEIVSTDLYYMLSTFEIGKEYKEPIIIV